MKKFRKLTRVLTLALGLVLGMSGIASAAGSQTTGLKDGIYEAKSAPNAKMLNTFFKLQVVVEGGKVQSSTYELRADGYPAAIPLSFADMAPTPETKDFIKKTVPEVNDYNAQMKSKLDGVKVTKYSKAANNNAYNTFQTLWKNVVKQAGGKITTAGTTSKTSTTNTSTTTGNPKTGDNGILVYAIIAGAALAGMTVLGKKKVNV